MENLIKEALASSHSPEKLQKEIGEINIVVVGVGGAGNNSVSRLAQLGIVGARLVCVNTDKQHLDRMDKSLEKMLIGESLTNGMGAGGYPNVGERAAEMDRTKLQNLVRGADLVFIVCGLGGGTGTGATPVIADFAKSEGALVISIATLPFSLEKARIGKAMEGMKKLRAKSDSIILIDNNRLLDLVPNLPLDQAFFVADEVVSKTIKGITETITIPSLVNVDFADIKAVMQNGGISLITIGDGKGAKKIDDALVALFANKLLDVDIRGAKSALIHITGGEDMSLGELNNACERIAREVQLKEKMIWGARIQPALEGRVEIILILTGIEEGRISYHFEHKSNKAKEDEVGIGYIE